MDSRQTFGTSELQRSSGRASEDAVDDGSVVRWQSECGRNSYGDLNRNAGQGSEIHIKNLFYIHMFSYYYNINYIILSPSPLAIVRGH